MANLTGLINTTLENGHRMISGDTLQKFVELRQVDFYDADILGEVKRGPQHVLVHTSPTFGDLYANLGIVGGVIRADFHSGKTGLIGEQVVNMPQVGYVLARPCYEFGKVQ